MSATNHNVISHDLLNISLRVDMFGARNDKYESLLRRVEFAEKPGIVYAATQRNAEELATGLQQMGVAALCYHGGLKAKQREEVQDRFISADAPVIVTTNAFGMDPEQGMDRPDIRFVYHADVSDSLDAYYHEIGRAGGDGAPAEAVLFYRPQDISAQQFKTGPAHVDSEGLEAVYNALRARRRPMRRERVAESTGLPVRKLAGLLHKLEDAGAAAHLESGSYKATNMQPLPEIIEAAEEKQRFQKELRKRRLQQMQGYAECRSCRREYLMRLFGGGYQGPCGNCDRCEEARVMRRAA